MKRLALLLLLPLAGCRHRAVPPSIPAGAQAPVPAVTEPTTAAVLPTLPVPPAPTLSRVPPPPKPARRARTPRPVPAPVALPPAAPPPTALAANAPPPNPLGSLTAGGNQGAEKQQRAIELLNDLNKRLKALSADIRSRQSEGLIRVRNFEHEAQAALKAGDTEGAVTLATKAKLLLDDLLK